LEINMDTWNREELYAEIWEKPATKVAAKYGISSVMLGKVCRKLQIPRPGRGYWAKKEFGKPVKKIPLPEAKDLPVVQRLKQTLEDTRPDSPSPTPEPTDAKYQRIPKIEARAVAVDATAPRHKLVSVAAKCLMHHEADNRGLVHAYWSEACLDVRVSKNSIDRALNIMNAVILQLEAEQALVSVKSESRHGTIAHVFGQNVPFSIVEKLQQTRTEVKRSTYTDMETQYQPNGELEFRAGEDSYGYRKIRDGKTQKLETLISRLVGSVLREARDRAIRAEERRLEEIEERKRAQERFVLREQIEAEEKKVQEFESWVSNWVRAQQTREFIVALEKLWQEKGHDLSAKSPKGERLSWMKVQADRLDPLVESPPSILDRKNELNRW
jgi:hypothetical protein